MTTPDTLEELLKIAEAATPGPWYFSFSDNATPHILTKDVDLRFEYDDNEVVKILVHTVPATLGKQYENGIFAARFHPTVAKALVKVAMAAAALKFSAYPAHSVGFVTIVHAGNINVLEEALADLAAALKEGK